MELSAPLLEAALAVLGFAGAWGTVRARIAALEKAVGPVEDLRVTSAVTAQRVTGLERETHSLRKRLHEMANRAQATDSEPPSDEP